MPTLFTRIINGELPGRFVWKDPRVVAFLTVAPIRPGHVLVVPRQECDHWIDLPPALAADVMHVAQKVGAGVLRAYPARRVGMMIAGLEVPHVHLHLVPIDRIEDADFAKQDKNASPASLDDAAARIRRALRELDHSEASD